MSNTIAHKKLEQSALGRVAELGSLYDARQELFCNALLFNTSHPSYSSSVKKDDCPHTDIKYDYDDSLKSKFTQLDVSAELQLSVLSGLVSVEGSGSLLKSQSDSAHRIRASLVYYITTKDYQLNVLPLATLPDALHISSYTMAGGTHVVTNIKWGARVVLTVEYMKSKNEDKDDVKGKLKGILKKFGAKLRGTGNLEFRGDQIACSDKFSFHFYGDVVPQTTPCSVDEAMELLKKIPDQIRGEGGPNQGKGVPFKYEMIPLTLFESIVRTSQVRDIPKILGSILDAQVQSVVELLEEFDSVGKDVKDFQVEVMSHDKYLTDEMVRSVREFRSQFEMERNRLRENLKVALVETRSKGSSNPSLEQIIQNYEKSNWSAVNVRSKLMNSADFAEMRETMDIIDQFECAKIKILKKGSTLQMMISRCEARILYVLYRASRATHNDYTVWETQYRYFKQLKKKEREGYEFCFVDGRIHTSANISDHTISKYVEQELLVDNVLKDLSKSIWNGNEVTKLLYDEYQELPTILPPDCHFGPISKDPFKWHGRIPGPVGTPYEGGTFFLLITFLQNYPSKPPIVKFVTPMYHPNILPPNSDHPAGFVDIPSLPGENPTTYQIGKILLAVISILRTPVSPTLEHFELPYNPDAAREYGQNRAGFNRAAAYYTESHAQCPDKYKRHRTNLEFLRNLGIWGEKHFYVFNQKS